MGRNPSDFDPSLLEIGARMRLHGPAGTGIRAGRTGKALVTIFLNPPSIAGLDASASTPVNQSVRGRGTHVFVQG
ncbi:MAG TPA: hypothetical protein VI381_03330, partial [Allosphingosinicella sp.]